MLSNTDFADLLKSGDSNGLTKDGKGRFNLEQVKTWDKQNNAQGKKKPAKDFGKTPGRGDGDEASFPKQDKYRDRAFERRKDVMSSEEEALEAVVSKLDAEQTKFLGGDVEHTHLVKGLDYALLRKIREKEKEQINDEDDVQEHSPKSDLKDNKSNQNKGISNGKLREKEAFKDFKTSSAMGESLKNIILNPTAMNSISAASKSVAESISRMAFDFDLSEEGDQDLPTTISRSKKEFDAVDESSLISCLLSKSLGAKLSLIFGKHTTSENQTERQLKRKRKDGETDTKSSKNGDINDKTDHGKNDRNKKFVPSGEVEDIFADIGKYVPVGALDEKDEKELKEKSMKIKIEESEYGEINENIENNGNSNGNDGSERNGNGNNGNGNGSKMDVVTSSSAKGLFSNLLPSFPTTIKVSSDSANSTNNNSLNNDVRNESSSSSSSGSGNKDISHKNATSSSKVVQAACVFDDDDEEDEIERAININTKKAQQSQQTKNKSAEEELKSGQKEGRGGREGREEGEEGEEVEENDEKGGRTGKQGKVGNIWGDKEDGEDGDSRNIASSDDALMAPIRALLAAQKSKELKAVERAEEAAGRGAPKPAFSLAMGADGRSRVHRDVFGGGEVFGVGSTGRAGDAMGHGAYDDYGGDNETYDSDQEDENEGKEVKRGSALENAIESEIRKDRGGAGDKGDRGGGERGDKGDRGEKGDRGDRGDGKGKEGGGHKGDKKDFKKNKERETEGDSSGNWRNLSSNSDRNDKGSEKQSAIRPQKENNRAARRAGKS